MPTKTPMKPNFTIEFRKDYIYFRHSDTFEITPENLNPLYIELNKACKKYHCRRVLAEGGIPPKRKMSIFDAFDSATQFVQITPGLSMAIVFPEYVADEITEFFKTSSFNRGAHIEFFSTKDEACQWLAIDVGDKENID